MAAQLVEAIELVAGQRVRPTLHRPFAVMAEMEVAQVLVAPEWFAQVVARAVAALEIAEEELAYFERAAADVAMVLRVVAVEVVGCP